jgi:hypothetical protein
MHASGQVSPLGPKCWKLPRFERLSVNACGVGRRCPYVQCRTIGTAGRLSNGSSSVARIARYSVRRVAVVTSYHSQPIRRSESGIVFADSLSFRCSHYDRGRVAVAEPLKIRQAFAPADTHMPAT